MSLTPEERKLLIHHRLEKAAALYDDALFNFAGKRYSTTANRLYYAVFHGCGALLLSVGIEANRHSGVRAMIAQHFVLEGKLSVDDGKLIHKLFVIRQQCDYDDFITVEANEVEQYIEPVRLLLDKIKGILVEDVVVEGHGDADDGHDEEDGADDAVDEP